MAGRRRGAARWLGCLLPALLLLAGGAGRAGGVGDGTPCCDPGDDALADCTPGYVRAYGDAAEEGCILSACVQCKAGHL